MVLSKKKKRSELEQVVQIKEVQIDGLILSSSFCRKENIVTYAKELEELRIIKEFEEPDVVLLLDKFAKTNSSQEHIIKTEDEASAIQQILHKAIVNKEVLLESLDEYEKPFIERLYDVSPEPDKRKEAIKNAVENCEQLKDFLYKNIITDDVASIPYV